MEFNEIYFYTATITKWRKLLSDHYKDIIIESLGYLVKIGKINVYGFVIMPNHIHLLWEMLAINGKEMPHESFMKHTGHQFLNILQRTDPKKLSQFKVDNSTRQYQFWLRNSLPILIHNRLMLEQKLDYIHANPVQDHWQIVSDFTDYKYSSAAFYELGDGSYEFLTHYMYRI